MSADWCRDMIAQYGREHVLRREFNDGARIECTVVAWTYGRSEAPVEASRPQYDRDAIIDPTAAENQPWPMPPKYGDYLVEIDGDTYMIVGVQPVRIGDQLLFYRASITSGFTQPGDAP